MQRVRLVLPYLAANGWEVAVLAVDPGQAAAPVDPWLAEGLPGNVLVDRVKALGLAWGKLPGLGTLAFRAMGALQRRGDTLLGSGGFGLVYFSTTQFPVHLLGPRWLRRFGVPFAMDYQDPWVNEYYRGHPDVRPPGGRLKYGLADRLNLWMEPRVLHHCSGITSVSPEYPRQLRSRYRFLRPDWPVEVLPFPGDERDLNRVHTDGTRQSVFVPDDGNRHWVYVGRGGEDMHCALRGLFWALRKQERSGPGFLKNLRLHFIGTSYAAAGCGRKTVEPLAAEYALASVVQERPDRIPYSQALRCLLDAEALIVPGSDDPGYTASKIYPYILARKPLLAVFHEQSSVVEILRKTRAGTVVPFRPEQAPEDIAGRILATGWLPNPLSPQTNWAEFEPYTARAMTARLCRFFETCLKH